MLTKDHIKARVRGKKIVPDFIDAKDQGARSLAGAVVDLFSDARGSTLGAIRDRMSELSGEVSTGSAFFKLVSDRCEFEDFDEAHEQDRWELFAISKQLRSRQPELTSERFQQEVAAKQSRPFPELVERIYADLPDLKKINLVESLSAEDLVNRYNLAQIQGLLLKSHSLTISVESATLADLRQLFHQIRFHRLLAELAVDKKKKKTVITLTGPLSQFDNSSAYGMQLAVFFPHLLAFEGWTAVAEVEHKRGKVYSLVVESTSGLHPIYKARSAYVPPELTQFIDSFNELSSKYKAERGGAVVNLGQEHYLIPDITITNQDDGQSFSIELFHKWHTSQLPGRLQVLEQVKKQNIFLGVARGLTKNAGVEKLLKESCWFDKNGFLFSEFPTAKKVFSLMTRICRPE